MRSFVHMLNRIIDAALVLGIATITVVLVAQVVCRYVLHSALAWPEELAQFLLVAISFLGMYRAIGEDQHIRIEWLPQNSPAVGLKILKAVGLLSVCAFLAYVGYGGWHLAMQSWHQPSTALRLPMAIPYLIVPISCLLSFFAIAALIRALLFSRAAKSSAGP